MTAPASAYELLRKVLVWPNPIFDAAPQPPAALIRAYDQCWNLRSVNGWRPVIEPLEFLRYPMPARWPQYPMWPVSPWMKLMLREVARRNAASVIVSPQMLDHLHDPHLRVRQWIGEILGGGA